MSEVTVYCHGATLTGRPEDLIAGRLGEDRQKIRLTLPVSGPIEGFRVHTELDAAHGPHLVG